MSKKQRDKTGSQGTTLSGATQAPQGARLKIRLRFLGQKEVSSGECPPPRRPEGGSGPAGGWHGPCPAALQAGAVALEGPGPQPGLGSACALCGRPARDPTLGRFCLSFFDLIFNTPLPFRKKRKGRERRLGYVNMSTEAKRIIEETIQRLGQETPRRRGSSYYKTARLALEFALST